MKITQLPKATAVTDSDIAVIVQNGETRQIPRTLLAPPPPDDIAIDGNTLHLTKDGAPIGTGAELPIPAPWAKQITYNRDALGDNIAVDVYVGGVDDNPTVFMSIRLKCMEYTQNGEQVASVTPLLSDFRGVEFFNDETHNSRLDVRTSASCIDIPECFCFDLGDGMISVSYPEFEYIGLGNGAVNVNRSVSVQTYQDVITKVSTVSLEYIYEFRFAAGDEELMQTFYDEVGILLKDSLKSFIVRYADIPYIKTAEVIQDVN